MKMSLRQLVMTFSLAANGGLLVAILIAGISRPGNRGTNREATYAANVSELALNVLKEKKALLEAGRRKDSAGTPSAGTFPLPWQLLANELEPVDRRIRWDGELPGALCEAMGIVQADRLMIEAEIRFHMDEARRLEKARSRLVTDEEDGSTYYVIDPDPSATLRFRTGFGEKARAILGEERGDFILSVFMGHEFFRSEDGAIEIAAVGEGAEFHLETRKLGWNGKRIRYKQTMDAFGLASIEERWGHIVDVAPWKEYVAEKAPSKPMESPDHFDGKGAELSDLSGNSSPEGTGSLLLDGLKKGDSFWD